MYSFMKMILSCFVLLCLLCRYSAEEEQETNKNIIKAQAKYNDKMAAIIQDAQKDADKAKADLMKAMNRELSSATKKGNFDEAVRIKALIEEMQKEDRVKGLFGDDIDKFAQDNTEGKNTEPQSKVDIQLLNVWTKGGVTAETRELLVKELINKKTNTATLNLSKIREILGHENYFNLTFVMGSKTVRVAPSNGSYRVYINDRIVPTEEKFMLIMQIDAAADYHLNHEIAVEEFKKIQKAKK